MRKDTAFELKKHALLWHNPNIFSKNMKKHFAFIIGLLFGISFAACNSQTQTPTVAPNNNNDLSVNKRQLNIRALPNSTANFDSLPANLAAYLPSTNETLIDYYQTDLNADHLPDLLLVMQQPTDTTKADTEQEGKRQLYVLLQQANAQYKMVAQNSKVVYCQNCGGVMGDPYTGITINPDQSFTVSNYGGSAWRWGIDYTFAYKNNDFFWIKETSTIFSSADPEHGETKQRTETQLGKVTLNNFDTKNN